MYNLFTILLTALIFSVAGIFFSDTIASRLTAEPELQELCSQYLSINLVYCWGIFLQTYGQRLLQAVRAITALLFNHFKNPLIHVDFKNYHFDWQDVADIYRVGLPTEIVIALCGTLIFCTLPKQLLQLFSASPEMLVLGIPALRIISIFFVFAAVIILCGYFASGLGNGMVNMISAAIRQLVLLIPCLWFLIKSFGITHGWYAFWIAETAACIYSYCTSHKLLKNISK